MKDLQKKLKNFPSENLKILILFLTSTGVITFDDIAKELGYDPKDIKEIAGKSIGGILSTLSRNKINDQSLIVSVGRLLGKRRMQWKINSKVFTPEIKNQTLLLTEGILKDRDSL